MSGPVNIANPEGVILAGRSAWRKQSRLPTSSFASCPESCPFIFMRGRKTCVDMRFTFSFFFLSNLLFFFCCYDFWNRKFVWYNTAKISKGVPCVIFLPTSVMDLFVCVFGWFCL